MVASTQGRQRNYDLNPLSVAKTLVEDLLHIHYRQPYALGALATADQHQLYTSTVFPFLSTVLPTTIFRQVYWKEQVKTRQS